ncbi:MAG: hypothetical protein Kow00105_13100 [Phycisphaeraceae bacterium]
MNHMTATCWLAVCLFSIISHVQLLAAPGRSLPTHQPEADKQYYVIEDIPTPENVPVFEPSALSMHDDGRLVVITRRGEVYFVDRHNGDVAEMTFHRFARGLQTPLSGFWRDNAVCVAE